MESLPPEKLASDRWVFKPHGHTDDSGPFKARVGDIIYTDKSAYAMQWSEALSLKQPLKIIQVKEAHSANVKFMLYEGLKGQIVECGLMSLSHDRFVDYLQRGKLSEDE